MSALSRTHVTFTHTILHTQLCQTHTHIHTYIRTCVRTYVHTYIQTHIHTYVRTYVHTYISFHIPSCFVTHRLSHATLSHPTVLTSRSFTTSFVFPSFPVPATTFEAHYWKKLTCGVIRSFNVALFMCVAGFFGVGLPLRSLCWGIVSHRASATQIEVCFLDLAFY